MCEKCTEQGGPESVVREILMSSFDGVKDEHIQRAVQEHANGHPLDRLAMRMRRLEGVGLQV